MTVSTETYYCGVHPYTLKPVYTPINQDDKLAQRKYFFWYDDNYKRLIFNSLSKLNRTDLLAQLYPRGIGQIPRNSAPRNGGKAYGHQSPKRKHAFNSKKQK